MNWEPPALLYFLTEHPGRRGPLIETKPYLALGSVSPRRRSVDAHWLNSFRKHILSQMWRKYTETQFIGMCCNILVYGGKAVFSLTISRHIQFYQLHEVGYFWRKSLNLVVTQAKFS